MFIHNDNLVDSFIKCLKFIARPLLMSRAGQNPVTRPKPDKPDITSLQTGGSYRVGGSADELSGFFWFHAGGCGFQINLPSEPDTDQAF